MSADASILALEGIEHSYVEAGSAHRVLRGIDLRLRPGETVALLGRSGSGKSTLLNVASGLARPDAGRVWIGGRELSALPERDRTILRRRTIGFIYQFFNLIDTLDALDNALLPLELDHRLDRHERQRVVALLEAVGLSERAHTMPDALSGGEQQRLALVRALAPRPELVLADEPTGNLDSHAGRRVLDLLERLVRDASHALLLVTHSPDIAARADRALELDDGVIAAGE